MKELKVEVIEPLPVGRMYKCIYLKIYNLTFTGINSVNCDCVLLVECGISMLEDGRAVLPKESGQPDEDDFASVPLANKMAKITFTKPSEVTSLQVRATSGLASEDTAVVTATFIKPNGEKKTTVRILSIYVLIHF